MKKLHGSPSRSCGKILYCVLVALFLSILETSLAFAQISQGTPISSPTPAAPAPTIQTEEAFQSEQQALASAFLQLVAQSATSAQIQDWQQQYVAQIKAQQQRAQVLAASQPMQVTFYITDVGIPEGANQTMQDFLVEQAMLQNARAKLYNQQLQNSGMVNEVQIEATFQQQNAMAIKDQSQQAKVLAQEADQQSFPMPPPLTIPAGASKQMQAFLKLHDELMRERIELCNQDINMTSSAKEAALRKWEQQNVSRIRQMQQLAQNLSQSAET